MEIYFLEKIGFFLKTDSENGFGHIRDIQTSLIFGSCKTILSDGTSKWSPP